MIYLLYFLIFLMLLAAVGVFYFLYYKNRAALTKKQLFVLAFFMIFTSLTTYYFVGSSTELNQWYHYGKKQYQFLMDYERLGGINGMITRLHRQLSINPKDIKAWVILGKLYIAKTDYLAAKEAFAEAHALAPNDAEISHYLDVATNPANYHMI